MHLRPQRIQQEPFPEGHFRQIINCFEKAFRFFPFPEYIGIQFPQLHMHIQAFMGGAVYDMIRFFPDLEVLVSCRFGLIIHLRIHAGLPAGNAEIAAHPVIGRIIQMRQYFLYLLIRHPVNLQKEAEEFRIGRILQFVIDLQIIPGIPVLIRFHIFPFTVRLHLPEILFIGDG